MWIGSSQGGVSVVDFRSHRVRRIAGDQRGQGELSADVVWQWLRDRSGLIWVAGYNGGLLFHDPQAVGIYTLPADRPETGLNNTQARAVAAAPGRRLWVAGLDNSLIELDPERGRMSTLHVPKTPTALAPGVDGSLWIGTQQGLCNMSAARAVSCPAGPHEVGGAWVMAVLDTPRKLWIGTQTGLFARDGSNGTVSTYRRATSPALANDFVTSLLEDRRGRVWVGTINGINLLDERSAKIEPIRLAAGSTLEPGFIESIAEDRNGRIWFGAYGIPSFVVQDAPDGRFAIRHIGRNEGLPESVDGVAVDGRDRLWASMDNPGNGIAKIDPKGLRVRLLGPADGVSIEQYAVGAVSHADDGTIFFGGLKGVTAIAPDASPAPSLASSLIVTALELGRRGVPAWSVNRPDAAVELPAGSRGFSVEFSALDYAAPQGLRYSYKLVGFDRDWVSADSAHRIATYTNLPPGNYTLLVRSANASGVWSDRELRLGVRALPDWYETWWFRILLGALLVALLLGIHAGRTALLRRRQRELEELVAARTRELQDANARLEELSLTDPLTGLRNRRFLTQHLETDIAMILRRYDDAPTDSALLFFMVDIDHFKNVNDTYGHRAGDVVLVYMRERLLEVFRESDIVVRWGGEEFLAVAHGGSWNDALEIAERIRVAVSSRPFVLEGGQELAQTASIGFAAFPFVPSAPRALTWSQVVELADYALYMAKDAGRNTWVGLSATDRTDPQTAAAQLKSSAEEAVRLGNLEVSRPRQFVT
jgi:diguanylate cyclase (GGDEF)-like protein